MRILALITARGGSKRLPGKNIRPLGRKPLIVWSIDAAKGISGICDILVSTDDPAIGKVALNAGVLVPWLRPGELATDAATSADVALHAINWYEETYGGVDGLLLLQPTSPFRSKGTIARGIQLFEISGRRAVIGITHATSHPMWCLKIEGDTILPYIAGGGLHLRSQDLPPAYVVNGAFYLIRPVDLRKNKSLFTNNMVPLLIDNPMECVDIDDESDWKKAESYLPRREVAVP